MPIRVLLASAILAVVLTPVVFAQDFAFPALLARLSNLEALLAPPPPGSRHIQLSSYDRKSDKGPADAKMWFANGDRGHFLRVEETKRGKEYVMADQAGPGYLVRIWSANPKGTLRIYLDGNEQPVIEAEQKKLLAGEVDGFPEPIAGERSRGYNLYLPLPFAKHIKVTSSKGDFYYHVNLMLLDKKTPVRTLTRRELQTSGHAIARAAGQLARPSLAPPSLGGVDFRLEPKNGERTLRFRAAPRRPRAIRGVALTNFVARDLAAALRQVLMVMTFDGDETVRVPLSEFFGCGPRAGTCHGLAAGCVKKGESVVFYNRFPMPFTESATVSLVNCSAQTVRGKLSCTADWLPGDKAAMRFHAVYREVVDVSTRPKKDVNLLQATGAGHVVGCVLTIRNPVKRWWGEGDEKVFVDGETFPSIFGTGTEDYFGYAWCSPKLFSHPYHAQPACDGPVNYGLTTVNRFHILDPIPFHKSIRFDMELWHWAECNVDYCTTTFFYGMPGTRDREPFRRGATPHWQDVKPYVRKRVTGVIEAEELKFTAATGEAKKQEADHDWSNEAQVWWMDGEVGSTLTVTFDAPSSGRYRVFGRFTRARDYGIHRVTVNASAEKFEYDFYHTKVQTTPELDLGVFRLKKTGNRMTVTCVGKNALAVDRRMFGLDYIKLIAIK